MSIRAILPRRRVHVSINERHDVGGTPAFGGDVVRALKSIRVPLLYMPSETDLYFPIGDARYEAQFIPRVR